MADESVEIEETGGIVTTVKKELTDDLDVANRIAESDDGTPAIVPVVPKTDDDDERVDVKTLPPAVQKLLNSSNAERRRQARQIKELETKVEELGRTKQADDNNGKQLPAQPSKFVKPVKPVAATFAGTSEEFDAAEEKYQVDLAEYTYLTKRREEVEQELLDEQQAEDAQTINNFNDAAEKFKEEHPDYEQVMDEAEVGMSSVMFGMVIEEGPYLGYYFAQNPDEAKKIKDITDNPQARKSERAYRKAEQKAIRAIDRIVVKLEKPVPVAQPETKPKQLKLPDPPARVSGNGKAAVTDKSKMSYAEREAEYARTHPGDLNYK